MSGARKRGFVPSYWWDFDTNTNGLEVIIETDDPRVQGGVVHRFTMLGDATIQAAERMVADLQSGRSLTEDDRNG
jgi:hypothetical protein